MNYLFVDNFRGFTNTLIPLKKINFFVGENSTGKTSILSLINLLKSVDFWFTISFKNQFFDLGNYSDLVSIHSSDKTKFCIGYVDQQKFGDKKWINTTLIVFKEIKGLPRIKHLFFKQGNYTAHIKFGITRVRYKIEKSNLITTHNAQVFKLLFNNWIEKSINDQSGYKYFTKIPNEHIQSNIIIILQFIKDEIFKRDDFQGPKNQFFSTLSHGRPVWIAPIRTQPRKTYDENQIAFSSEGKHTPYLIKQFLQSRKLKKKRFIEYINRIGKDSGLFDTLKIKKYGRGATSPFELNIVIDGEGININNVGYGVSQVLPVLIELFSNGTDSDYLIQQPEIHLHPKAQATLGDVIYQLRRSAGGSFFY